jgi:hypothetical protein
VRGFAIARLTPSRLDLVQDAKYQPDRDAHMRYRFGFLLSK